MSGTKDIGTFVIANGASDSSTLDFNGWRSLAQSLKISGPGTLTGAVKLQVSHDAGVSWKDVESNGADVTIPADGNITVRSVVKGLYRVTSAGAEGAERTFIVQGEDPDC